MSGLINKAKEMLHHDKSTENHTAGPHDSDMKNKADPRVDSDRDGNRMGGTGTSYGSGATGTTGHHTTGHHTTAGPHSSDVANKADPRVDSDRDGSRMGGTGTSYGTGATGTTGHTTGHHTTAGPHSSDLANKADPRVDSDRDGSRGLGSTGTGYGSSTTGSGYGSSTLGSSDVGYHGPGGTGHHTTYAGEALDPHEHHHGVGSGTSTTSGPHSSNILNKVDPRVDSDRDGSRNMGATGTGYGSSTTGTGYGSSTTGTTGTSGYGNTHTSGPHNSDALNRADPRVDSDRDGSRTYGGSSTGTYQSDELPDASKLPPSQFHGHASGQRDISDHARRHSISRPGDDIRGYGGGAL